jgi:hypothetical protein
MIVGERNILNVEQLESTWSINYTIMEQYSFFFRLWSRWLFKCLRFVPPLAPFEFQPHDLREIVGRRDFLALKSLTGGTDRLMKGLFTSTNQGIVTCQDSSAGGMTSHDFGLAPLVERRRIYGRNRAWDSSLGIIYQLARNIWKPVVSVKNFSLRF